MQYLVSGFARVPKDNRSKDGRRDDGIREVREMRLLITELLPGEHPEDAFRRKVSEMGFQPGTVFEVLVAN